MSTSEAEPHRMRSLDTLDTIEVIETLANGVNPVTGEVFPETSPYNHPVIIRALFAAIKALQPLNDGEGEERNLPENAGKPWSEEEDQLLAAAFESGTRVKAIATSHCRTDGAIVSRLVHLGRISKRSKARRARSKRRRG